MKNNSKRKELKHEELGNIFLTRPGTRMDWPTILGLIHPTYEKMRIVRQDELRKDYAQLISLTRKYLLDKGWVLRKEGWGAESVYYTITKDDKSAALKRSAEALDKEKKEHDRAHAIIDTLQDQGALPSDKNLSQLLPVLWESHQSYATTTKEAAKFVVLLKDKL
jgi:ribosomal protein S6